MGRISPLKKFDALAHTPSHGVSEPKAPAQRPIIVAVAVLPIYLECVFVRANGRGEVAVSVVQFAKAHVCEHQRRPERIIKGVALPKRILDPSHADGELAELDIIQNEYVSSVRWHPGGFIHIGKKWSL